MNSNTDPKYLSINKAVTIPALAILTICRKCNDLKPVSFFVKDKRSKTSHSNLCKECNNKYYREKARMAGRPNRQRKASNFTDDQIVQKMHEFYYKLGYLPDGMELKILKSEIGIKGFAIKKEFKKQFDLHFKNDNPKELRAKCPKCSAIKYLSDFRSVKKAMYGTGECKDCMNQYRKKLNESKPGLIIHWKEYRDRYYKKHSDSPEYKLSSLYKQLSLAKKQTTIDRIISKIADLKKAKAIFHESKELGEDEERKELGDIEENEFEEEDEDND